MKQFSSFQLTWVCLGLFLVACNAFASNEVYALTCFKEAILEDPLLVLSNWNTLDADPCDWSGISCSSSREYVKKINISWSSLKGFLAPELSLLSSLQELILPGNGLIGTIPKEIGQLKSLKVLDLGVNQLSGSITPELGNLTSVMKISLRSNLLTGRVPPELGNLKYLEELRLDGNNLQGTVPGSNTSNSTSNIHEMFASTTGFCRLSQLKVANFSNNFLVGSIPKCLENLSSSSFEGNCLQGTESEQRPTAQCGNSPPPKILPKVESKQQRSNHHSASKPAWFLALKIMTGSMVGCLFLVAILTVLQKWKSKPSITIPWKKSASHKDHMTISIDCEMLKDLLRYSREELEVACEDFSNIIGSSPDSLVYKGTLKGGPEIAVISLGIKEEHWTDYLELYFQREVADLARLDHENTGKLLGYCRESNPFTRMLVFEYASNGTLYEHLHYGEGCHLSWTRRMKIAIGIARALGYLHTELEPPFTISELNSSAVYLTDDFSPKLVDFESWKTIVSRSGKNSGSISNEGPICVISDSLEERALNVQGNVYAFGVLLLEIISGRPSYCEDKGCLVDWAKDYLELPEVMSYVVDPELKYFRYEDVEVICEVVSLCIHQNSASRVSMQELCAMLENRIDTDVSAELKASSLGWAELALSS